MNYPDYRPRRMRRTEALRRLVRETRLSVDDFVYPLFVVPGSGVEKPISSMPGQYNLSVDKATETAARAHDLGIPAVILFGIPEHKDAVGTEAWKDTGVVQKAIRSTRSTSIRSRSWRTRPSTRRATTGRFARRSIRRRSTATAAATRWTRPTWPRRCARSRWTSPRAPTS